MNLVMLCKPAVLWILFKVSCWILFLFQAFKCAEQFTVQKPATATSYDEQENWPISSICFGPSFFYNQSLAQIVDKKDYDQGAWRSGQLNLTEKELFDLLTPKLYDLISGVKIQKFTQEKTGGKSP